MIARSLRGKLIVTVLAAVSFASLYVVTVRDSQYGADQAELSNSRIRPVPGARLLFSASAYCKGSTTASGVTAQRGVAAADPDLLPVGSVIEVHSNLTRYSGIYTVMDTGPSVQGRRVDFYMWSCYEALSFGRQPVHITVLRLGWNPRAALPNRSVRPISFVR